MSGEDIAAEIAAGIAEAGAETGNGAPLVGAIVRPGEDDKTTFPPTPGVPVEYACTLILTAYTAQDRAGTNITERDMRAIISPDAETEPRNGDVLRVAGEAFSIVNVDAVKPGGVVLMWKCQVRHG